MPDYKNNPFSPQGLVPHLTYLDEYPKNRLEITIPGEPGYKERARASRRGKHVAMYTPKKTVDYTGLLRQYIQQTMAEKGVTIIDGVPITLNIIAVYSLAKSHHRKRVPVPMREKITKPDKDNIEKVVMDAGNGVLWRDDCLISSGGTRKFTAAQGESPYIFIQVLW